MPFLRTLVLLEFVKFTCNHNFTRIPFLFSKFIYFLMKNEGLILIQLLIHHHEIQVASSALGFGPQMAMQLAERLYTQGFIRFSFHFFLIPKICPVSKSLLFRELL